jgi:uncharacterized protein YutE (UPF0331/DUF86 family)
MKSALSPTAAIGLAVSLLVLLTLGATAIALSGHAISLNETQIMYLFSTSSQVIAAIYGLTLTGFIFFRNELNREEFEDETLAEAVETLKARYFVLLVFITVLVSLTLLLANLEISYEASGEARLNTLIINAGQSAFLTSLVAIAYFVFDVISPKRIERASKTLQSKVDPSVEGQTKGSLEEFLKNYNQIEALLKDAGKAYQDVSASSYERRYPKRLSNSRLAEILARNQRIDKLLFHTLRELITLRNSIIHGAEPVVSQAIVETSSDALQKLRAALDGNSSNET